MRKLILLLALIIIVPEVLSIGIAPAYKEVFYEPGKEIDISFRIINNEKKDMDVLIYAKGELSNNIEIATNLKIRSDELEKTVPYKVILPLKLAPGTNVLNVYVVENTLEEDSIDIVKTHLGVAHKLMVIVPYPGEYLQGMMFVEGTKPGEQVQFTLSLNNLGTETLENIKGTIVIRDSKGKGISQLVTDTATLKSKEKGKITAAWQSKDVGKYIAQAVISYGDEVLLIEKELEIGEALITIRDIRIVKFRLGDISRMDILLENNWNEDMPGVLTKTVIYDASSNVVSDFDSSPVDIGQSSTKEVPSYWETQGVEPGNYVLNIVLEYLGKKNEKSYQVAVDEDSMTFLDGATGNVIESPNEDINMVPALILVGLILAGTGAYKFLPRIKM
jgi:hypothetical protein